MENGSGSRLQLFLKSVLPSLFSNISLFSIFKTSLPLLFLLLSFCFGLPLLLQNFAPRFVPLFLKKSSPLHWFYSLPCIYRQPGERFTIPCPSAGHGGVGVAGYGCVGVGMGHARFLGKWGGERERKNSGKNFKNILLLPWQGRRSCTCRSKRHRAVFFFHFFSFFEEKENKI